MDSRETSLLLAMKNIAPSLPVRACQLLEGDVVISLGNKNRIWIERKSIEDLYNSVRSNRLSDQVGRMFNCVATEGRGLVALVLEGSMNGSTPPCVYQTYYTLLLREKLPVVRTDSVEDTASFIISIARRAREFFLPPNQFSSLVHVERSGRKTNGLNVPYLKLLMSISGVSANRAHAIALAFPTMDALVGALKSEGGTTRLALVVASSRTRSVGSPLGTATALNIAEALLGPTHPEVAACKLVKYLVSLTGASYGDALKLGSKFKSIPNLYKSFLSGGEEDLPEQVCSYLAATVDDQKTLSIGLKGVFMIGKETAEALSQHFGTVRELHAIISNSARDREAVIRLIRQVGSSRDKRITRKAAENVVNWLIAEGYVNLDLVD